MSGAGRPTAIVTGGGRGIGRAIVARCLADGMNVVSCGRADRPEDLPAQVLWLRADVARPEDAARIVTEAFASYGRVDTLVNNAGVQVEKTVADSSDADWDLVMGVNARGTFNMCRALLREVIARDARAVIVNIGSISGAVSDPSMALYNASKAFVHGLTRSIAVDHGPHVRCNAVCPGWIMTDMAAAGFALSPDPDAAKAAALARHPVGRFGQPEDIANLVAWLVSDQAGFVTGQCFTADGGLTAASPLQPGLSP